MKLPKIAAAAALLLSLVATPAQAQAQQSCAAHYLVAVPGGANTAEGIPDYVPHGGNVFMTGVLTRLGTGGEIHPLWVSYRSTPFATSEYEKSKAGGLKRARATVRKLANACPDAKFSFTGYSLGADIAATITSDIAAGRGPIEPERVSGVALFANPHQGGNGAVLSRITAPESRGALGELKGGYGELGERVLEICNPRDIVCSTDAQYRPLVEPALATDLRAGKLPLKKFNVLLSNLGIGALGVFTGMGAHGQYTLADQQEASNWIISHA